MATPDEEHRDNALDVVAGRIAQAVLGHDPRAPLIVKRSLTWLTEHRQQVGDDQLAWLAAQVTLTCGAVELSPLDDSVTLEAELLPGLPRRLFRAEIASSDSSRAAVLGLMVGAGFGVPAAAHACRRSDAEMLILLGEPLRSILFPTADIAPAVTPQSFAPLPPAPLPRTGERRTLAPLPDVAPTKRRWRRPPLGVILSMSLMVASGVVVTWGGGPRPSFADATIKAADRLDERLGCEAESSIVSGSAQSLDINVGQLRRNARVFVPPTASRGTALPLLVLFGDYGTTPDEVATTTNIEQLAVQNSFIVAIPAPLGDLAQWNVVQATSIPDDVAFASTLVEAVASQVCVDPDRVVLAGHGDGGHMAAVVACRRSDRVAAIAMINGTFHPSDCRATRALPVLAMVDQNDDFFPMAGGFGPAFETTSVSGTRLTLGSEYEPPSADAAMQSWATLAGCTGLPVVTPIANGATESNPTGCREAVALITRVSAGGGHGWPAVASQDIWTFLSTQKRR